jgi:UDP-2,3-diacylglucosamine pyrophosphatase LpxH
MTSLSIFLLSDIHTGDNLLYFKKKKQVDHLISSLQDSKDNDSLVVLAGDLTHNGYGDAQFLCFSCCLCSNTSCIKPNSNSSTSDELLQFDKEIFSPLKNISNKILLCHGNHDESSDNMSYPVLDFIKKSLFSDIKVTNDGFYFYIQNDILFLVLGKYPSKKSLQFFDLIHKQFNGKYPYILIFHYQVSVNTPHDFWSKNEKDAFACFIDDKNIICILHGHVHLTYTDIFYTIPSNKPILALCGSGEESYAKITIENGVCKSFEKIFV